MRIRPFNVMIAAGLILIIWPLVNLVRPWRSWLEQHRFSMVGLTEAVPSLTYLVETNRWLDFEIQSEAPFIKIISNASLTAPPAEPAEQEWAYAMDYRLLDSQGTVLQQNTYHFKTQLTLYTNLLAGKVQTANFYLDRQLCPLNSRFLFLNLTDPALANKARHLQLRLNHTDAGIVDVAVRVYLRTEVSARKLKYLWNRLTDDQKKDMARGNVYSFQGLSEQERLYLLRYHWSGAAPEGIARRDYQRRTIYIREDLEWNAINPDWMPVGLWLDAQHRTTLPLPNQIGGLRLELRTLPASEKGLTNAMTLNWFGLGLRHTNSWRVTWTGTDHVVTLTNQPGLLELQPDRDLIVRAFLTTPNATNEITPEPVLVPVYYCEPDQALTYQVLHGGDEPTCFRIDLRRIPDEDASLGAEVGGVHFELLDRAQTVVQTGFLICSNSPSVYDFLQQGAIRTNLTEPTSWFFVLPAHITALRLTPRQIPMMIHAYNRPAGLAKTSRIPEDYFLASREQPEQVTWFSLRALDHEQRSLAQTVAWVTVQNRPPNYDLLVLAGRYQWESFLPQQAWQGRMALLPVTGTEVFRPGSEPFLFRPVTVNQSAQIHLGGQPWETNLSPSLIVVNAAPHADLDRARTIPQNPILGTGVPATPATIVITIDGQPPWSVPLQGAVSEIKLPPMQAGPHALRIEGLGSLEAFMNYLVAETPVVWLKRLCLAASSEPLSFVYEKRQAGDELLVVRLFSPANDVQPCRVHAVIRQVNARRTGPWDSVTILDRWFEVSPEGNADATLLGGADVRVDLGQPLFIPVGADLPTGRYQLDLSVLSQGQRWLVMSRTIPGDFEEQSFTVERK
jgi:hypothetical protein